MATRVAIVTGSNKGIGLAIVKNLCEQFSGTVFLTARDVGLGKAAVDSLKKLGLTPEFHQLDIDDDNSVSLFTNFIKDNYGGIDVLVNNAAIAYTGDATEPFSVQAENTIRINYFGTLRVCQSLFPLLRPHARVVNVSSSSGFLQRIPGEDLKRVFSKPDLTLSELNTLMESFVQDAKHGDYLDKGWPSNTYVVSKVGVSALSRIQQREMLNDPREDIVINHVHPGYVSTSMTKYKGPLTVEQGAEAPTMLALLPEGTTKPKGDYVWFRGEIVDWINGPTPP